MPICDSRELIELLMLLAWSLKANLKQFQWVSKLQYEIDVTEMLCTYKALVYYKYILLSCDNFDFDDKKILDSS